MFWRKRNCVHPEKPSSAQLTCRKNIVLELIKDVVNIDEVKENMFKYALVGEFKDAHTAYQKLLNDEDRDNDTDNWFKPKIASVNEHVNNWLSNPPEMTENDDDDDNDDEDVTNDKDAKAVVDVAPHESASQVSSKVSSTASSCTQAKAEKAASEAKLSALRKNMPWRMRRKRSIGKRNKSGKERKHWN